jgi:hypothetical protein
MPGPGPIGGWNKSHCEYNKAPSAHWSELISFFFLFFSRTW